MDPEASVAACDASSPGLLASNPGPTLTPALSRTLAGARVATVSKDRQG